MEEIWFPAVLTAADCQYRIEDFPAGPGQAFLRASVPRDGVMARRFAVNLRAGEVSRLDMQLAGDAITRTLSRGGEPVPGAFIAVRSIATVSDQGHVRTDGRGRRGVLADPANHVEEVDVSVETGADARVVLRLDDG